MQSLPLFDLRDMCNASGRSSETNPVLAITETFRALKDDETPLSTDDDKLLFELSINLMYSGYHGMGSEALTTYTGQITANGLEYYRPAPDPIDPPQP